VAAIVMSRKRLGSGKRCVRRRGKQHYWRVLGPVRPSSPQAAPPQSRRTPPRVLIGGGGWEDPRRRISQGSPAMGKGTGHAHLSSHPRALGRMGTRPTWLARALGEALIG
jgi:hypothetical protein